jgi:hypothetical protein
LETLYHLAIPEAFVLEGITMKTKLAMGGFLAAALLLAHHSFSAEFDGTKPIQLVGVVTKIEWANPHVYFYIDVTGADGKVENWDVKRLVRADCCGAAGNAMRSRWATT